MNTLLSYVICGIADKSGIPKHSQMIVSWSLVEFAVKIGLLNNISAKMQPKLHISTAVVYYVSPNNNSGGLYHLVVT